MKKEPSPRKILSLPRQPHRHACRDCAFPDPGIYNREGGYYCPVKGLYVLPEEAVCSHFLLARFRKKL